MIFRNMSNSELATPFQNEHSKTQSNLKMKKYILLFCVAFSIANIVSGQEKKHAIGLRNSILSKTNFELSYQYYLNETSRLEFGLGTAVYALHTTGVYQKVSNLSAITPGLKIYGGVGIIAGFHGSKTGFGAVVQAGLEYNFRLPIQISLDYRPKVFFPDLYYSDDFCISIRYKF